MEILNDWGFGRGKKFWLNGVVRRHRDFPNFCFWETIKSLKSQ